MTTNQTIDGVLVSRELLELALLELEDRWSWAGELRALLDADKVNNRQMGLMQFVGAHPIKPAAQGQGEPVAYEKPHYDNHYGYAGGYVDWGCPRDVKAVLDHVESVLDSVPEGPLYAEQPAPVAVVLPELDESAIDDLAGSSCQEALAFGVHQDVFARLARTVHKRTLDEVTRLNTK